MEIIFCLTAYLLGSIPTAVWTGKLKYGIDVREHGSKNAGATNTFRVLGKKPGVFVLSVDILKGSLATMLPLLFLSDSDYIIQLQICCAFLAILGHLFPVFAGVRGGKGVATCGNLFGCISNRFLTFSFRVLRSNSYCDHFSICFEVYNPYRFSLVNVFWCCG